MCRTTAEFASMSMAERLEVTELTRQYWPGTIINNISAASHVDALQYLRHSQDLVSDCQVVICNIAPKHPFSCGRHPFVTLPTFNKKFKIFHGVLTQPLMRLHMESAHSLYMA